jgi:hypothetical protein
LGDGQGELFLPLYQQVAEKVIIFRGLLKNAQMQGPRNPED